METISFKREIFRKIFHLGILVFPFLYYFLHKWTALMVVAPATAAVFLLDYYRDQKPQINFYFTKFFGILLRAHELDGKKLCGVTWGLLAATLIFLVCKEEIVITSFAILAISDAAAALVGRTLVSEPFFEKSFAGSVAFYVSGLLVLFFCGSFFDVGLWFYLFGFFALFAATLVEARPSLFEMDDNFTVPVTFATIMTVFDWMWNYIN